MLWQRIKKNNGRISTIHFDSHICTLWTSHPNIPKRNHTKSNKTLLLFFENNQHSLVPVIYRGVINCWFYVSVCIWVISVPDNNTQPYALKKKKPTLKPKTKERKMIYINDWGLCPFERLNTHRIQLHATMGVIRELCPFFWWRNFDVVYTFSCMYNIHHTRMYKVI